jgi:hypothetical protein
MPTTIRAVEVNLDEAILLADLYGIVSDLATTLDLCGKVIELSALKPRDYFMEEGLMTAAVVRYGRCFTEGVRLSLKLEDLMGLDEESLNAHDYFLALRHKFIAHAVNAFEETHVTASARETDGKLEPITSVHPGSSRILLTAETAQSLASLASAVSMVIKSRVISEEKKLLLIIQALPLETIHAGQLRSPIRVEPKHVHERRKRGMNSNSALKVRRAKRSRP